METMSVSEFKKNALGVFKRIAQSGGGIIITRYGKAIAQVTPVEKTVQKPTPDRLAGTVIFENDIVSPLGPDDWESAS